MCRIPRPITSRRWICVVHPERAPQIAPFICIDYACNGNDPHFHFRRNKVRQLIEAGAMKWVGKHERVATFVQLRNWRKTYVRNEVGEVYTAGMQLVR
jgi:hypothetical protein